MPLPIMDTCRKRKRKPSVYSLQRLGEEEFPISRSGSFRDNVRVFLRDFAEVEDYNVRGSPVWCTLLSREAKNTVIPLYTIEEDVVRSSEPYCDHCRCTGWSNHFVSKRKYHFIIPVDAEWDLPLEDDVFDLQTHLLHGLIHTNGFGHLICVNGLEGGSRYLCGREMVDLWDRICTNLGARMITVEDLSQKRSLDLRLLYGVAYGHSWFGRWGYKFCRGSYGVTKNDYENAIELLGSLELDQIEQCKRIKQVFRHYREMSEGNLKTFKDLLRFILIINEKSQGYRSYNTVAANLGSRWPVRRLEYAAEVIVEALKEMKALKQSGMTRQDVRDSARLHIGDTGLLDYVLKSMNNVIVGNVLVQRYELDDATKLVEQKKDAVIEASVRSAAQVVLDSKHFVKEWPLWDNDDKIFRFVCRINNPSLIDLRTEQVTELPPGELVKVSLQATVFDLKQAIEETFRDTYCILTNFEVNEIDELKEDDDDSNLLFGKLESCSALTVRGGGIDLESTLKFQGGSDTWMVKCVCRARDDDGERMISCDVCEVWQHTRCCGIDDSDTLPPLYVCSSCCDEFAEQQKRVLQPKYEFQNPGQMLMIGAADDYFAEEDEGCLGMMMFPSESFVSEQFIL
ncbi:BnaCnng19010D [Brassica napus]|uniref:BnaCnng19010D protein n=1 Tax=Brassica napus TaxID=3708 RepID=A0A078IMR7_BRANA|nr:BnaCnng19010D [Brassica napus]